MHHISLAYHLYSRYVFFNYCTNYLFRRKSQRFKKFDHQLYIFRTILEKFDVTSTAKMIHLTKKNGSEKIDLRKTSSDIDVCNQIFIEEEYRKALELIDATGINVNNIVDAGANIGASAIYFSTRYPNAKILTIEPFEKTFNLMKDNLELNKIDGVFLNGALWSKNIKLDFDYSFRDGKEWSIRTVEKENGKVIGLPFKQVFDELNSSTIDLFKIDIEGSEYEVILNSEQNIKLLAPIKAIVMEIHDDAGDRKQLYSVLEKAGFTIHELGELTLFINKMISE